ncbi:MAG TPA: type II secretion system protein [Pyrinomonadaceae bacterium]
MSTLASPDRERGFSLIELLIVVAVMGILAALVVPNLLKSKQSAYNASAIASLRLIRSAEASYHVTYDQYADLNTLGTSHQLSDPQLIAGQRGNYNFAIPAGTLSADFYEITGTPTVAPWNYFYMDVTGIMRVREGAPADSSSPPLNY